MIMDKAKLLDIDWKKQTAKIQIANGDVKVVPLAYYGNIVASKKDAELFDILVIGPTYDEAVGILIYRSYIDND
jgi:hypothetical protein